MLLVDTFKAIDDHNGMQPGIRACQEGENDTAEVVIVFEPEGTSLMMGGLHPRVSAACLLAASHVQRESEIQLLPLLPMKSRL